MADKTISALTGASTPLAGTEVLPIVQGGSTVKVSIANVTAGRAMSALSGSFGTGTPAYSIGGTQVGITNTSANAYLSIYGGVGSTNGGFLLGGNNAENFANLFWSNGSNFMQIATTPVSSKVQFNIAGVVAGDITTNGFAPAAGKGIDFSANPNPAGMTSELLDDYEEGTWTPVDTSGAGLTFVAASGSYTKVGNLVSASGFVQYPVNASANGATIGGLPFTSANTANRGVGALNYKQTAAAGTLLLNNNATDMLVVTETGTVTLNSQLSNSVLYFGVTYSIP
jgi:hypothetical protein